MIGVEFMGRVFAQAIHPRKRQSPADRVRAAYQAELNAESTKRRINDFERSIKVKPRLTSPPTATAEPARASEPPTLASGGEQVNVDPPHPKPTDAAPLR